MRFPIFFLFLPHVRKSHLNVCWYHYDEHKDVILMFAATVGVTFLCFIFTFEVRCFFMRCMGLSVISNLCSLFWISIFNFSMFLNQLPGFHHQAINQNEWGAHLKCSSARCYWKHILLNTVIEVHEAKMFHVPIKYGRAFFSLFILTTYCMFNSTGIHTFPLITHWPKGTAFDALTYIASLCQG